MKPALLTGPIAAVALGLSGLAAGTGPATGARLALCGAALGAAAAFDLAERRIPNRLVIPATLACAGLTLLGGSPPSSLLSGLALVALLLVLSMIQPAALGMGDVKLALLLVFGLNGEAAAALILGLVLAACFGLLLLLRQGRSAGRRALPLAPFLAAGAFLALIP